MATKAKSKAVAKKAVAKPAVKKAAAKKAASKLVKPVAGKPAAKAVVKSGVRQAAKASKVAKAIKVPAKVAKAPAKVTAKTAKKAVVKAGAAKSAKGKPQVAKPAAKARIAKTSGKVKVAARGRSTQAASSHAAINPVSTVRVTRSVVQTPVNPKDLAAAHEYLLARSATRSEEPIIMEGRRLPTEEEVLKMPDSAYMNSGQLAFFKFRLKRMEADLMNNADETTEKLRETVIVPDPADRATIEEEHALELRTRDRERKLLKKVQTSLAAIESGDYGFCEETGDPIGIPRLLARPTATLSLEAQQRREMKQKLFGD
jgi:DnaK suppressor protein